VIRPEFARWIFRTSFLFVVSSVVAFSTGLWVAGVLGLFLCATSLCYWKLPLVGLRRKIDMCAAFVTFVYVVVLVSHSEGVHQSLAAAALLLGLASYGVSEHRRRKGDHRQSARLHCLLHACMNVAFILVCSGLSERYAVGEHPLGFPA